MNKINIKLKRKKEFERRLKITLCILGFAVISAIIGAKIW